MIRFVAIGALAAAAVAQAPSDPISDRLRFEIAVAQRDYLIAKAQYDAAMERLRAKTTEAETACAAKDMTFEAQTFRCVKKATAKTPPEKK